MGSSFSSLGMYQDVWTKNTKMVEDDENGECPQAVKLEIAYFASNSVAIQARVYRLLLELPLFHRLALIGNREKVCHVCILS